MLDIPGQAWRKRVEIGDGRPDHLGAAQELREGADVGGGGERLREGLRWDAAGDPLKSGQSPTQERRLD
ncbi:hypothetical protein MAE02_34970 [Microvirga aerophila]|uniref:Uncharacterized protein n=1 Tax=Microvirga aerophila TaxID=670291 RepID=A0A512BV12_9HYPH|nr:hypothetical protein MAE02_34970 [Microvirga aerophila]